ncbi:hypothetical protein JCM10914_583 [Paenibacillus sp. JCM 10914]|nr:hypothetical protein JCM10914_583 [Paenibacillus sp. JCM 10914]
MVCHQLTILYLSDQNYTVAFITGIHENNKKPPPLWDESYAHVLPPKFPVSLRITGSSAVKRRPLTLAYAAPLRQSSHELQRSKADPPRPFSETCQDRFAATPALCARQSIRTYLFLGYTYNFLHFNQRQHNVSSDEVP